MKIKAAGEIFVAGRGLARDYWRKPHLTKERFFLCNNEALYRTGDIAYYQADGTLTVTGRLGQEIKIRGQRLDVEMVEYSLRKFPAVAAACVSVKYDLQKAMRLIAYIALNEPYDEHVFLEIRASLENSALPKFAIPAISHFIKKTKEDFRLIEKPGDKITYNRKMLLEWPWPRLQLKSIVLPQTELEEELKEIWYKLLAISLEDDFSIEDDFFDLGGDSLTVISLQLNLQKRYPKVNWTQLTYPPGKLTIKFLAAYIQQCEEQIIIHLREEGNKPPIYCVHSLIGDPSQDYQSFIEAMKEGPHPLIGIKLPAACRIPESIEKLAQTYVNAILKRRRDDEAVFLVGWSTGGLIVLEIGKQLKQVGVGSAIFVLDTIAPIWLDNCSLKQHADMLNLIENALASVLAPLLETEKSRLLGSTKKLKLQQNLPNLFSQAAEWFADFNRRICALNVPKELQLEALGRLDSIKKLYSAELYYRPRFEIAVKFFLIQSQSSMESSESPTLHWDPEFLLQQDVLAGDHFSILQFPTVTKIADLVLKTLQKPCFSSPTRQTSVPREFNLPQANNHLFTGRERELNELEHFFKSEESSRAVLVSIAGLGGVGKTQLATYYIRNETQASFRFWFHAETQTALTRGCLNFAMRCSLIHADEEDKMSEREIIMLVKNYLENNISGWIAVYDNAGDCKNLKDFLPTKGGSVIVTTRQKEWCYLGKEIEVVVFSEEDATTYLEKITNKKYFGEEKKSLLALINDELDKLPLALAQAGAYMKVNAKGPTAYLKLYQKQKEVNLLSEAILPPGDYEEKNKNERTVMTTWAISLEAIQEENRLAIYTLETMSYFYPDLILRKLLEEWLKASGCAGESDAERMIDDVIGCLLKYSMIQVDTEKNIISVHRLVQRAINHSLLKNDVQTLRFNNILSAFERMFDILKEQKLYTDFGLLKLHLTTFINFIGNASEDLEMLSRALNLSNHLHLEAFSGFDKESLSKIIWDDHNTLIASLPFLRQMYQTERCVNGLLQNMEQISRRVESWQDLTRVNLWMASEYLAKEDRAVIEKAMRYALNFLKGEKRPDRKTWIVMKVHHALLQSWAGEREIGMQRLEKLLPKVEEIYGSDSQLVAIIYSSQGFNYKECGLVEKSIKASTLALRIFERYIAGHPITDAIRMNLAVTYRSIENFHDSQRLFYQAWPTVKETTLKNFLNENQSLSTMLDEYENGISLYMLCQDDGLSSIRNSDQLTKIEEAVLKYRQQTGKTGFLKSIQIFLPKAAEKLVGIYNNSPRINAVCSLFTGWSYPGIPRLKGNIFWGKRALTTNADDFFNVIKKAAELSSKHPRGMCYFWISSTQAAILLTRPREIFQVLKVNSQYVTKKMASELYNKHVVNKNITLLAEHNLHEQQETLKHFLMSENMISNAIINKALEPLENCKIDINDFFIQFILAVFSTIHPSNQPISKDNENSLSETIAELFSNAIATSKSVVKLLTENPEKQEKLKHELRSSSSELLSFDTINNFHYLRAIIIETLRLYPLSRIILRSVEKTFTLVNSSVYETIIPALRDTAEDIRVKSGDLILISPSITHHKEDLWKNADTFSPERHFNAKKSQIMSPALGNTEQSYKYLAFGVDESFLDWKLMEREVMMILAIIYLHYDLKIDNEHITLIKNRCVEATKDTAAHTPLGEALAEFGIFPNESKHRMVAPIITNEHVNDDPGVGTSAAPAPSFLEKPAFF